MTERDLAVQDRISSAGRNLSRRGFINRAAGTIAGGLAGALLGPLAGKQEAFASSFPCVPPCNRLLSGCSASAGCPSGWQTCFRPDPFDPNVNCCIYFDSWWYTAGSVGQRHKCRDCRVVTCPCCCNQTCCQGFGGCRSTIHY